MNRPLKVAHIVDSLGVGGLEKVVVDIISHFNKERISASVYCVGGMGEYAQLLDENGIEVSLLNANHYPLHNVFALSKIFKREKFDIVHSHSGVYRDATLAGLIAKTPIIVHTDHGRFYPDSKWTRFNHRFFSHFRNKIIAVSNDLAKFLTQELKISQKKVITIYNAVDVKDHDIKINIDEKKKQLGISSDEKVLGVVARLAPVKDHKTLFLAFRKVRESYPTVKLLAIGRGILEKNLKELARQLGEDKNIIFLGKRSDIKELLQIMDIVCLSSLSEGLSITLTEAMASAKPVVATNVGGNPELIIDGVTGVLVSPQNPGKMADAIIKLLSDETMKKSMGEEGRKRVQKEFNMENIAKEYEELYFGLAKTKGIA